jgi:hypothetical protein
MPNLDAMDAPSFARRSKVSYPDPLFAGAAGEGLAKNMARGRPGRRSFAGSSFGIGRGSCPVGFEASNVGNGESYYEQARNEDR